MTHRTSRLALLVAFVLLLVAAGSVMATRAPVANDTPPPQQASEHEDEPEEEAAPSAEDLAHARDRLEHAEIEIDEAVLEDLASRYGVGGAVRLYAWEQATGESLVDLAARRDAGMGWGQIARELDVHPGIGSIMGNGGGHGRDNAPGQQKNRGPGESSDD
ncbi:MAG: hypothetical protein ACR2I5_06130 [Candidatus Limnocylindria bacterium]